jgi:DNA-binding response OmpR family regulator
LGENVDEESMEQGTAALLSGSPAPVGPSGKPRVVVVDDEPEIVEIVTYALERAGIEVIGVNSGEAALEAITTHEPDLVVLDLMLPGMDGMSVLRNVRKTNRVPVILLSAIADVAERVAGLELGADDYVVKPFSPRELSARVTSVLRRAHATPDTGVIEVGELRIDPSAREVHLGGQAVSLTTKEFDLLAFLASSPRKVLSREMLLREVWDSTAEWQDPATVTEHVRRVRQKIEADPQRPRWIQTIRGVGYRFES